MPQNRWDKYLVPDQPQQPSPQKDWSRYLAPEPTPEPERPWYSKVLEGGLDILDQGSRYIEPLYEMGKQAWDWGSHTELLGKYPGIATAIAGAPAFNELRKLTGTDYSPVTSSIANQTFTPVNLGMALATGGEALAARAGMKGATLGLNALQRIASAPMIPEGIQQISDQDTLLGKGFGALELAGGLAGIRARPMQLHTPTVRPPAVDAGLARTLENIGPVPEEFGGTQSVTGMINPATGRPMKQATNAPGPLRQPDEPFADPFQNMTHSEFMDTMRKPPVEFTRAEDVLPPLKRTGDIPEFDASLKPPREPEGLPVVPFDKNYRKNRLENDINNLTDELAGIENRFIDAVQSGDEITADLLRTVASNKYEKYHNLIREREALSTPKEPQSMAATKGGIKIGADIGSLSKVLGSSLYQGDISHVATKELMQNSLDAVKSLGGKGKIEVTLHRPTRGKIFDKDSPGYVEVADNGPGLTKSELETVFTDLGASGKRDVESAIGGFGLAKAAPLLGGERVQVTTVSLEPMSKGVTQRMQHSFEGTPEELIAGVKVTSKPVGTDVPTGTRVRTYIPPKSDLYKAERFVDNLIDNSPFTEAAIHVDKGYGMKQEKIPGTRPIEDFDTTTVETPGASLDIMVPKGTPYGENYVKLQLLNQGMWQGGGIHEYQRYPGIPEKIMVNVRSKVPEGHPDYPFTANRESLRGTANEQLNQHIKDVIIKPSVGRRVQQLKDVYNSMEPVPGVVSKGRPAEQILPAYVGGMNVQGIPGMASIPEAGLAGQIPFIPQTLNPQIPFHVYDVGRKFSPQELQSFINNPKIVELSQHISDVLHDTLEHTPWDTAPLEKIGLIFHEAVHGIHIPSPGTGNSAILINPFVAMAAQTPDKAAASITHTIFHELAHISDVGHDEGFTSRLADLYTQITARRDFEFQERFFNALTDPRDRTRYSPEVSQLLQQYQEVRGRTSTIEDPLVGTGISSRNKKPTGTGKVPGGTGPSGTAVTKLLAAIKEAKPIREEQHVMYSAEKGERLKQALKIKGGGQAGAMKRLGKLSGEYEKVDYTPIKLGQKDVDELFNAIDSSAIDPWQKFSAITGLAKITGEAGANVPQRYELAQLDKVFGAGFSKSLSDAGFIRIPALPKNFNLVHEAVNFPRAVMASSDFSAPFRQGLGLITRKEFWTSMDDMFKAWGSDKAYRATMEAIEEHPKFSVSQHVGLQITDLADIAKREEAFMSVIAEKVPLVTRSERAYMAYLNKLRFDTFGSLLDEATRAGLEPLMNEDLMREIATYVNNATGRGSLGSWEKSAVNLNNVFFSPRLIASRVRMLDPATYVNASPFVRQQYLRSMIGIAGAGATVIGLAKMAGAAGFGVDVETNPSSADFGKARIGNVRLDPWGGFQQYLVAAHRLITGQMKSTTTEKEFQLGEGYGTPTRKDIALRFGESKLNPAMSFITTLLQGKDFYGQPISVKNEIMSRIVPILYQDLYALAKDDPNIISPKLLLGVPAAFGMGIQSYEPRTPKGTQIQYGETPDLRPPPNIRY